MKTYKVQNIVKWNTCISYGQIKYWCAPICIKKNKRKHCFYSSHMKKTFQTQRKQFAEFTLVWFLFKLEFLFT